MSLFDRWKKQQKPVEEVIKGKSQQDIVAEIHKEFKTATDSLLIEAKKWLEEQPDTSKGERLAKLGFTGTKTAKEYWTVEREMLEAQRLFDHINECDIKYPGYKFITQRMAHDIAEKYDLFIGMTSLFVGEIPENNIRDIEKFSTLFKEKYLVIQENGNPYNKTTIELSKQEWQTKLEERRKESNQPKEVWFYLDNHKDWRHNIHFDHITPESQLQGMKICATIKDFNMANQRTEGRFIVKEDPIVLFPTDLGYIVVTAWGPESLDVVNEKFN